MNITKNPRVSDDVTGCALTDLISRYDHDGMFCLYGQGLFSNKS